MRTSDVFDLLRDGRPRTRAQLAEETGLARSTVTTRVDQLMDLGLVLPHGGVSTGGRPPSLFSFNPQARLVAGVDVGATHVAAVLADLSGEVLVRRVGALDVGEGPEAVLAWAGAAIGEMLGELARPAGDLVAIGIGLPGPVEYSTGRPINPPIMPGWDRFDVPGRMQRDYPVPVLVDNDVNIMALGEQTTVMPDVEDLIFIKVSTGIGAGIISGGRLQRGAQGTAGDLGHVVVERGRSVVCRCGNEGCLEAIAAVPALDAQIRGRREDVAAEQGIVDLVRAGDTEAIQVVRQAGRDLGEVVAIMVNLVNPSAVVIGGRLAAAGEHLIAGIREVVYQRSLPLATEHLQIIPSRAQAEAGVLGAVALAVSRALSAEAIDGAAAGLLAG